MNFVQTIILTCFDLAMLNLLTSSLLKQKFVLKSVNIVKILFYIIAVAVCSYYIKSPTIALPMSSMVAFIMLLRLYKKPVSNTIYLYMISMVIMLCAQIVVMLFVKIICGSIANSFLYGLISQICTALIITLIQRYIQICEIFNYIVEKNTVVYYLLLNSFAILIFIVFYWYMDINGVIGNLLSILVLSMVIVFINFIIVRNGLQNQFKEQELKIYKTYLPVIEQLMDDIRARQHEFDNHIQALRIMQGADAGNNKDSMDELIDRYCTNIIEKNKWNYLIKLNNKMLAGFLYSKIIQAAREGIEIEVILDTYFIDTEMEDFELIEATGIMINNAFEAEGDGNCKRVTVKVSKQKDMNVIEVRNRHPYLNDEIIQRMFKKGFSTKGNNSRGYGLYNLNQLAAKYKGRIELFNDSTEDNYVVVRVYFM